MYEIPITATLYVAENGKIIHNYSLTTELHNSFSVCITCFGPISGHHQVLHLKYLEEKYCCTISVSEFK